MIPCVKKSGLTIHKVNDETIDLANRLSSSLFYATLLQARGLTEETNFQSALDLSEGALSALLGSLHLGDETQQAAEVVWQIPFGSKVVVYGDYDVDGISATSLAMQLMLDRGACVRFYIPHRFKQGYGFHSDVAREIAKLDCQLVIVVDCGTQDEETIGILQAANIPVLVFDHHMVENNIAHATAIVNPQINGDDLAKKLCATGVIWCWMWQNKLLAKEKLLDLLDIVAMATVADCMSLSSHLNKVIVSLGTRALKSTKRRGLRALMQLLDVSPQWLSVDDIAMKLVPCLNAAGRLYYADVAVAVMCGTEKIEEAASTLVSLNKKRRELSSNILDEVEKKSFDGYRYVLANTSWACGVLSSVASRICAERNAPVALVSKGEGHVLRGTLRMPQGGDAVGVLKELSALLKNWGGHRLAAGFSVLPENWEKLRDRLEEKLSSVVPSEENLDAILWDPNDFDKECWSDLIKFGPFGVENACPSFYVPLNGDENVSSLGQDGKHSKIKKSGVNILAFGVSPSEYEKINAIGLIYTPHLNTWRNIPRLQFVLEKMVID